jgi:hypothetical protein
MNLIKHGMTEQQVIDVIGEPTGKNGNLWYYERETNAVMFADGYVSAIFLDYTTSDVQNRDAPVVEDEMFPFAVDNELTANETNVKVTLEGKELDVITNSVATLENNGMPCIRVGSEKAGYALMIFLDKAGRYKGRVTRSTPEGEMATATVYSSSMRDLKRIEDISVNTTQFALGTKVVIKFSFTDFLLDERPIVVEGVVVNMLIKPFTER